MALGDGNVDLVRFVGEFRRLCPQVLDAARDHHRTPPRPLPYLEADFWKAFPKMPAWEFARFVALAKSGHPFMGAMVIEDVAGKKPAGDGRRAQGAAAHRSGAQLRVRQEKVERRRRVAGVSCPASRGGIYSLRVAAPLMESRKEFLNRFILWPEVAQQDFRIADWALALLGDQLVSLGSASKL